MFRELSRGGERVSARNLHVGLDTDDFPPLHEIGTLGGRHLLNAHAEVVVDAMKCARVLMAGRGFSDDRGPLQHLDVVDEILGRRLCP